MAKQYNDPQDVLNEMQPILDSCAKRKNYIDGIAVVLNAAIIARSEVPEREFDYGVVPALLNNLSETTQDTFGERTNLQYASFKTETDEQLQAWSTVFPYKNYGLVFTGKLNKDENLQVHQATVPSYVEQLLPLIEAYDNLT